MSLWEVTPTLFLSAADGALNAPLLRRRGITLIVNATLTLPCAPPPGVECMRVPVADLPAARLDLHFEGVSRRIHSNRTGATLVHCAAGMSRSPALVMAYLMRYRGTTLRRAHALVRDSRPDGGVRLNTGFWEQLLRYERRLHGENTVRVLAPLGDTPRAAANRPQWEPAPQRQADTATAARARNPRLRSGTSVEPSLNPKASRRIPGGSGGFCVQASRRCSPR